MKTQELDYDIIIVGGGPGGSTAGYILNKLGFKVLIIDKNKFPRDKLCGGLITKKTLKLHTRIYDETEENLENNNIINYKSNQYKIFYKKKLLLEKSSDIPFYFVERIAYDNYLIKKARETGVKIIENNRVKSVNLQNSEIITENKNRFRAKFIIGADGTNSIVRKQVFQNNNTDKRKWQKNLATAFEIYIKHKDTNCTVDHPAIYFGYVNFGYSWIFPNKDKILIGMGGLQKKNKQNLMDQLNNFLSDLNIEQNGQVNVKAHTVPYGNYLMNPALNNTALIGDAAGFADPIIGEGIYYAQRSGELVACAINNCIKQNQDLKTAYLDLLHEHIYPELSGAKRARLLLYCIQDKFHFYPTKLLFHFYDKKLIELVHGKRSYKNLRKGGEMDGKIQFH